MAAAKVIQVNCINKHTKEKEVSAFSKLLHPNVMQFRGYGVQQSQPVMILELMSK
jgi:hypothetical protein